MVNLLLQSGWDKSLIDGHLAKLADAIRSCDALMQEQVVSPFDDELVAAGGFESFGHGCIVGLDDE
jgi:hypothetical protein